MYVNIFHDITRRRQSHHIKKWIWKHNISRVYTVFKTTTIDDNRTRHKCYAINVFLLSVLVRLCLNLLLLLFSNTRIYYKTTRSPVVKIVPNYFKGTEFESYY